MKQSIDCPYCNKVTPIDMDLGLIEGDEFRHQTDDCVHCGKPFALGVTITLRWKVGKIDWRKAKA